MRRGNRRTPTAKRTSTAGSSTSTAVHLQVRDEQGYVDNVQLHQGTIINPTGITLEPGMVVSILGYNSGP